MKQAKAQILRSPARRMAKILTGIVIVTGVLVGASRADNRGGPVTAKMVRQIGVMEKIIDKVLVDSPNFLVRIDDNTRGLFVPEYGVVFTLDASLTGGMIPDVGKLMGSLKDLSSRFEVKTDKDGNSTIVIKKESAKEEVEKAKTEAEKAKAEAEKAKTEAEKAKAEAQRAKAEAEKARAEGESPDEESDIEPPEPPRLPPTPENWVINSQLESKDAAERYSAGKDELIQALLDYGDTLTSLRSGQHVMIAAFLKDSDYFKENKISRLVIKAGIDDLRAYGEGKLSDKDARSRIDIEEY